jgi:hypothetical protein
MPTPLTPTGIKVQGRIRITFAPTGSLTAPSLAIMTGATALDVSNIFYEDSWAPSKETNKGSAPRRLGTAQVWEQGGITNHSLGDLRYQIDPQGAALSDGKKAYEKFPEGTVGYFYWRFGMSVDTDFAIGQFVQVAPVQLLARNIGGDPADEFAEFSVSQQVIVTAPGITELVAIVA